MLNDAQFLEGMKDLMDAFKDFDCPPDTVELYRRYLAPRLTPQEWRSAIDLHIVQGKWFPKVSEINDAVLTLHNQGRPSAAERWGQLLELASQGAPEPTDLPTKRALTVVGGWHAFQFEPETDLNFRRKEFERVYGEAMAEEDRSALLGIEGAQEQRQLER